MNKFIFVLSLFLNVVLLFLVINIYFSPVGKPFIATENEIKCLERWKQKQYEKHVVWGPDLFEDHVVVFEEKILKDASFEIEMSGCFYDAVIEQSQIDRIPESVSLLRSQGYSDIAIYKSKVSDIIRIYGK